MHTELEEHISTARECGRGRGGRKTWLPKGRKTGGGFGFMWVAPGGGGGFDGGWSPGAGAGGGRNVDDVGVRSERTEGGGGIGNRLGGGELSPPGRWGTWPSGPRGGGPGRQGLRDFFSGEALEL